MSIVKTASKKIVALIRSMKFFLLRLLCRCIKSMVQPYMEYCYVWAGAPSCYLELLDKLQKCRTVSSSLTTSVEPLGHRQNIASLSLFYRYYFGRCWLNWIHFLILEGGLLVILLECMTFLSPFLGVTRVFMSTVSFLGQLDSGILCLWNAFLWPMI